MSLLNGKVALTMLQFSVRNLELIPPGIPEKPRESVAELMKRMSAPKGREFISPTPEVSALQFVADLKAAGYRLVECFYQIRNDDKGKPYAIVRFVFADEEHADPSAKVLADGEAGLAELLMQAAWRVQGYLNPYFNPRTGQVVKGLSVIAVNLGARFAFVDREGNPILRRKKQDGKPVGEPVPIEPERFLRIVESGDVLVV